MSKTYNPEHGSILQLYASGCDAALFSTLLCCLDRDGGFSQTEEICGELVSAEGFDSFTLQQRADWLEAAADAMTQRMRLPEFPEAVKP